MSQHLLRVATVMMALVGGAMSCVTAAAPHPTIRVKVLEDTSSSPQLEPTQEDDGETMASLSEGKAENVKTKKELNADAPPQAESSSTEGTEPSAGVEVNPIISTPLAVAWQVNVSDGTVRQALSRWAMDAGWVDHWELDVDIPITADATLATTHDFTDAVQRLAEAVALSEAPFRPCFYSNNVVRIVPYNAMCNRTMSRR